jgi:hypothetical protein
MGRSLETQNNEVIIIEQKGVPGNAPSGASVCFIFSNLSFLFWANLMGYLGDGAGFAIGIIQLGVFVTYHVAASLLFTRGEAFDGNIFMVFATFFGGVGGATNIASAICAAKGIPFDNSVVGICWIMCGIFLLGILPGCKKSPWTVFVLYLLAGIGLFIMGLITLGIVGMSMVPITAWLLFAVGALGLYLTLSTMNSFMNINIPLGKPLFKIIQ